MIWNAPPTSRLAPIKIVPAMVTAPTLSHAATPRAISAMPRPTNQPHFVEMFAAAVP